jgi:hypothetical protein
MALATSNINVLNQDPKFYQDQEMQFFQANKATRHYNTRFQNDLTNGSIVKLTHEAIPFVEATTGHDAVSYGNTNAYEETFTVTEGRRVSERVFDTDNKQASFDVKTNYVKNGLRCLYREMDQVAYQKMATDAFNILPELDLTALANDTARGNAAYTSFFEAGQILNAGGFEVEGAGDQYGRRVASFAPEIDFFMKFADNYVLATEEGESRLRTGKIRMLDSVDYGTAVNVYAGTTSFDVTAKGVIAVGVRTLTVDNGGSGTINKPAIGDTFVNDGKTFTIQGVKQVTANVEYEVTVDRPIEAQIADDATISIAGRDTAYNIITQGATGAMVVQKNPQFEEMRDPDYNATLVRSMPVMFDCFQPIEAGRRTVVLPIKYRTIS